MRRVRPPRVARIDRKSRLYPRARSADLDIPGDAQDDVGVLGLGLERAVIVLLVPIPPSERVIENRVSVS